MSLISIIVPVYNVEKYIDECINSILEQTFTDFELLLIDDGSTDSSGSICDNYALMDKRIRVFHKENGGLSSARNYGIDRAVSPYLGFVDSDDYIEPEMYMVLYDNMIDADADISICCSNDVYKSKVKPVAGTSDIILAACPEDAIRMVLDGSIVSVTVWNKLYKRKLFNIIRFKNNVIAEDSFIMIDLLKQINKAVISKSKLYNYRHRAESIITREYNIRDFDIIDSWKYNYEIIEKEFPLLIDAAKTRIYTAYFYVLDKMMMSKNVETSDLEEVVEFLRSNGKSIINNKSFNLSRRVSMTMLMFSKALYKVCVKIKKKMSKQLVE